MRVLYFGSYNQDHPRNNILIDGLREGGTEVVELNERGNFFAKSWRLFTGHRKHRGQYDFMIVGFPGFTIMPLAKLISTAPIVFDAFLSFYDSNVFDRKVAKPGSLMVGYYYFLDWLSCRLADIILLDTNEHIDYFVQKFHVPREKFRRIFIGAHDKIFKPIPQLQTPNSQLQVLFWGWIIPLHGVEYILDAAQILAPESVNFTFVGGGAEKGKMMAKTADLGLKNVQFLDAVKAGELPALIASADICLGIFGGTEKTKRVIPNKLYEALASRKAIITAATAAVRETLVDREHALFCKVADGKDLAEKILELKNNPELRKHLEEEGYKLFMEKFSPKVLGKELLTILHGYKK